MNGLKERLQLQMNFLKAAHNFYLSKGYEPTVSPKIVPFKDDEEDHLIKVKIIGKDEDLFLSRSPQLYKEISCLFSEAGKVYEIGPVFRGEPEGNGRRANEFLGIDAELKTESLDDVINSLNDFIFSLKENEYLIKFLSENNYENHLPDEILRIEYKQALKDLKAKKIGSTEEKKLSELVNKNSSKMKWIFLTDFPAASRGFYQIKGEYTDSFDLIGQWEICSGGLRRKDVDTYFSLLEKIGWSTKEMIPYAEIKKKQEKNTGGYGVGMERLIGTIINRINISEIQPYERTPEVKINF